MRTSLCDNFRDLSNNSLTGQVPDFLSQLTSLRVLKLNGNYFTGSVPAEILKKSKNGLLSMRSGLLPLFIR
ncbi:hypothetical protein LguiA_007159 [Lonicera macranthoides]